MNFRRNETDNSSSDGFHYHFPIEMAISGVYNPPFEDTSRSIRLGGFHSGGLSTENPGRWQHRCPPAGNWDQCDLDFVCVNYWDRKIWRCWDIWDIFEDVIFRVPSLTSTSDSHGFFRIPMDDSWSHGNGKSTKLDEGFNGRIISCGIFEHAMITSDQIQDSSPGLVTPEGCAGKRPLHHCLREYRCCHMIHQVHHDSTIKPTDFASFCHHFSSFWWENIFKTWSKHSHQRGMVHSSRLGWPKRWCLRKDTWPIQHVSAGLRLRDIWYLIVGEQCALTVLSWFTPSINYIVISKYHKP